MPRMIFFFFYLFFKIYVISSLFFFQAQSRLRVSPAFPFWLAGEKPIWGLPSPCPAVKAHLSPPCWRSAQLSWLSPGKLCCRWATGLARHRDRGESKGEGKLHAWVCRQNEPPSSARASRSKKSQCLVLPPRGSDAQINPCAPRSLPAPAAGAVSSCKSRCLLWLQTKKNLFQRQELIPQAQLLKHSVFKISLLLCLLFFLFFL